MGLSRAFTDLLSDRRDTLNARVAQARARNPSFDTATFAAFLETQGDPVLTAALARDAGAGAALADAIFNAAIALTEHRWAGQGAHAHVMRRLWSDALPQFGAVIAGDAKATIAALSNATIKVSQEPGIRIDQWLANLAMLGSKARHVEDVRDLVVICTWRAGIAHLRDVAMESGAKLPPAVACAAVGAAPETDWAALARRFAAHHWWAPETPVAAAGQQIGSFSGFGGLFVAPPIVCVADDRIVVQSRDLSFALFADAYGATLRPIQPNDTTGKFNQGQVGGNRVKTDGIRADDRIVPLLLPQKRAVCR